MRACLILLLCAGARVNTFAWARAATDDIVQLQYMLLDAANLPAASSPVDAHADVRANLLATWQLYTLVSLASGVQQISTSTAEDAGALLLLLCG